MLAHALAHVLAQTSTCTMSSSASTSCSSWTGAAELYEYSSNANPTMSEVPFRVYGPELHQRGPSAVIPFDLRDELQLDYAATSPNLLAGFVRVLEKDSLETGVEFAATSQAFYVIRGSGASETRAGRVEWQAGDMFVLPYFGDAAAPVCTTGSQCVRHECEAEPEHGGCAIYWVHDEPLLQYLGAIPARGKQRFAPAFYSAAEMNTTVNAIPNVGEDGAVKNRRGILLGNVDTPQTRTLTPTLWSLLNTIGAGQHQRAHKHTSVALDLAVVGTVSGGKKVYTKLGRSMDETGEIIEPIVAEWVSGGVFITPPGWWHSHHNEGEADAWVLPIQDAGVYTHQRTLDIRFADEEVERLRQRHNRGATIDPGTTRSSDSLLKGDREAVALHAGAGAGALAFGH